MHLGAALDALDMELEPPATPRHARVNFCATWGAEEQAEEDGATSLSRAGGNGDPPRGIAFDG